MSKDVKERTKLIQELQQAYARIYVEFKNDPPAEISMPVCEAIILISNIEKECRKRELRIVESVAAQLGHVADETMCERLLRNSEKAPQPQCDHDPLPDFTSHTNFRCDNCGNEVAPSTTPADTPFFCPWCKTSDECMGHAHDYFI